MEEKIFLCKKCGEEIAVYECDHCGGITDKVYDTTDHPEVFHTTSVCGECLNFLNNELEHNIEVSKHNFKDR